MRCKHRFAIAALAAIAGAFTAASCSQTETSITAPSDTGSRCQVTATPTPPSFPPPGGQGSVTIATTRDCTWSIATDAAWVSIAGNRTGQGDATVAFNVAANPVPSPRSAAIMVAGQSVAVSQQAAPCVFSLSRPNDTIAAEGGRLAVDVATLAGCRWTAASAANWIAIASGSSGDASGTVGLSVAANGGAARSGQVSVAGQSYTVNQAAVVAPTLTPGPTPNPAPPPQPAPRVHFDGTITGLSGSCPNLSFTINGRTIVTEGSTNYPKKVKCGDVRNGQNATGEGDLQASDTIKATKLEVSGENH